MYTMGALGLPYVLGGVTPSGGKPGDDPGSPC